MYKKVEVLSFFVVVVVEDVLKGLCFYMFLFEVDGFLVFMVEILEYDVCVLLYFLGIIGVLRGVMIIY